MNDKISEDYRIEVVVQHGLRPLQMTREDGEILVVPVETQQADDRKDQQGDSKLGNRNTIRLENPYHARIVPLLLRYSKTIAHRYKSVSPSAHLTKEQPALIVSAAPTASREGFTSTKSMAIRLPVSCTHSAM